MQDYIIITEEEHIPIFKAHLKERGIPFEYTHKVYHIIFTTSCWCNLLRRIDTCAILDSRVEGLVFIDTSYEEFMLYLFTQGITISALSKEGIRQAYRDYHQYFMLSNWRQIPQRRIP